VTALRGIAFPFRIDGGIARAAGFEKLEQDVRHLLSTRLGERTMRRDFGGGVHHHLQEPLDSTLQALVRHEIEVALRTYMPEVELLGPIAIEAGGAELHVALDYVADPTAAARRLAMTLPLPGEATA
jgi:phage baseplate assembly protein W